MRYVEKKIVLWRNFRFLCMTDVKKSQIFSTCGVISDFSSCQMWRNLKFVQQWHVCDVEIVKFMMFCCKIGFIAIYALLSQNLFCRGLRTFVWRKI